jgi:hypothetical protein
MAGQSIFAAGTALVAGLPWLRSATVSLRQRLPRWSSRVASWAWTAALALLFLALVILLSIMGLYAVYTLGGLAIDAWQALR